MKQAQQLRVALVVDTYDWAFANIARQIERAIGHKYKFEIIPHTAFENFFHLLALLETYDFVHIFWREVLSAFDTPYNDSYANGIGCDLGQLLERFYARRPVTTAVYDHLFLSQAEIDNRQRIFSRITGYTVSSNHLRNIYSEIPDYPEPALVFSDGVDLDLFKPERLSRFSDMAKRPLVVGWVGNSAWAEELGDPKGVNSILIPALNELKNEGLDIQSRFADRQARFIPHFKMPAYYREIDLYICTSQIEGTPNPVLEAMASGVPIITTNVGIVPDAFGSLQQQFILKERSIQCLKAAILRISQDRSLFAALSDENLNAVRAWDWKNIAPRFGDFIEDMRIRHEKRYIF